MGGASVAVENFQNIRTMAGLVLVVFLCPMTSIAGEWEIITEEDNVVVDRREVAGRDVPTVRGRSVLTGSIYDVLTVLDDTPRRHEWVYRCVESYLVKKISDLERYVYNRTEAPWPVSDRDIVSLTKVSFDPEKMVVRIAFEAQAGILPEIDGVVRIPYLRGFYLLEAVGDEKTRVTYTIDSDPGGWLPNWLIKLVSKKLPLTTLRSLQGQVNRVRSQGGNDSIRQTWLKRLAKTPQVDAPTADSKEKE